MEHLQRPKDSGGLALPNPWLYYLAAQLQHLIGMFPPMGGTEIRSQSSAQQLLLHTVRKGPVPVALEALAFAKPHKKYPTFNLIQKIWNKARYIQSVEGYTE